MWNEPNSGYATGLPGDDQRYDLRGRCVKRAFAGGQHVGGSAKIPDSDEKAAAVRCGSACNIAPRRISRLENGRAVGR